MYCSNCGGSTLNNTGGVCPYCGKKMTINPMFNDIHTEADFRRDYSKLPLISGFSHFLCLVGVCLIGGSVCGVCFYFYMTSRNSLILEYRRRHFDYAYMYRTKMRFWLTLCLICIPLNYIAYMIWSIKSLLSIIF